MNNPKDSASSNALPEKLGFMSRLGRSLKIFFFVFIVISVISVCWRFLDLYEASVRAESVHARIALERHQLWMEQYKQQSDFAGSRALKPVPTPTGDLPDGDAIKAVLGQEAKPENTAVAP
jgi:hypothetical protein